ncbi:hypothetical protein PFICI_08729 [Pestalotiopsis fici W106-1]|uniref:WLM domain-containing protein n=1 Tax=Pestalotiopsis fici (strain W106-1 / CGMCC3.15140) TaxID=1229662 RepID=W3X137_PESFW|nr:uncharacterized protein PFICI_08729 [Pestalotiopsis fici W106-1]ETS78876.1 hypothetical protein PFICI_08729 [Pestalotiopsis fici W106-1]
MADSTPDAPTSEIVSITLSHDGKVHSFQLEPDATITDLANTVEEQLSIPVSNQKFIAPKLGLLKAPFKDPNLPVAQLDNRKPIKLMGTTAGDVADLNKTLDAAAAREAVYAAQRRAQPKIRTQKTAQQLQDEAKYTFHKVEPLRYLPNPERSRQFLERLKADPGIVSVMRKRQYTVGLLTEMDPLSNTESNHEGTTRLLGLNRNRGQVIELRLRTDAYDGYRDYKTIRKTLCHELTHNVHGDHDRKFWDLCHQIEKEVAQADWKSSGRSISAQSDFYEPSEEVAYDHGGWTGGEFVLGSGPSGSRAAGGRSIREVLAEAAEERIRRTDASRRQNDEADPGQENP